MKQAELAHYRELLRAQAVEPPRRGIFAPRLGHGSRIAVAVSTAPRSEGISSLAGPPPSRPGSLFGRKPPEPQTPSAILMDKLTETLVLDRPVLPSVRLRREEAPDHALVSETPYHAEDLADPPTPVGPAPGIIAGWSKEKPPSAQVRLLRRLAAVIEAERQGLGARLAAAGVEAA